MKQQYQPLTPAALYTRVSSDRQDVDLSVAAQLRALRDYARNNGYTVAREYVDEAESGRIADRPQFRNMIDEGGKATAPFQVILVWKFSRFTRKREHAVAFKSMLRRKGIRVVSITEHADDSPTGKLMEAIIESVDEFYSGNLAQEVVRGMRESASRGYFLASRAPFGYNRIKVSDGVKDRPTLEVDPVAAPIVKEIFESSRRGNGLKEICKELNGRGITNRGRSWQKNVVHYLLTNEAYTGTSVWGVKSKDEKAGEPVRVENAWTALVSRELFDAVQQGLHERAPTVQRPARVGSQYLLSGLLRCGVCGKLYSAQGANSGQFAYYICATLYREGAGACTAKYLNATKVEDLVIEKVRERILTEETITELVALVAEEIDNLAGEVNGRLTAINAELADVETRLENLYQALETKQWPIEALSPRILSLKARQDQLTAAREEAEGQLEQRRAELPTTKEIKGYVADFREFLQEGTFPERKALIRNFVQGIEIMENEAVLTYTIPMPSDGVTSESAPVLDFVQSGPPNFLASFSFAYNRLVSIPSTGTYSTSATGGTEMVSAQSHHNLEQGDISLPATGRPVVRSTEGIISSGHYLTSMSGMRMLLAGGNAFDALVAAGFAAAVVEPIASYSLAAEGVFMLYDASSGDLLSLSGQGTAPGNATADFYLSRGHQRIPTGPGKDAPLSFTLPGIVDAFISLLERYGTMELSDVIAPAVSYAAEGIPNYEYMLERLHSTSGQRQFDNFPPGGWDVFYHDREVPPAGSLLVQPGLATTLQTLRDASAEAPGDRSQRMQAARDAFYRGPIARLIVECSEKVGGIISTEDLASYSSRFETPVGRSFHGYEIQGQDSWSQGPMLMQTLNILENFDLKAMGHNSPAYIHTVSEALKLCFGDREAFYADPDYATVPVDGLLSKEYAAERAQLVDPEGAYPAQPPAGDPWRFSKHRGSTPSPVMSEPSLATADPSADDGTTHVSVLDRHGNLVCGTISGGSFAKSVFFPELGCALSTRIEMFNCEPGHPNVVEPGKRPRTTLVNYIISKEGQPLMTVGCPGGDNQVQANVQLMLNSLVFGMDPQQAVEASRFATASNVNSFYPHVYYPGQLDLEPGIPDSTADALRVLGHKIERTANCGLGATVSVRDDAAGSLSTGADPRRACYALVL